MSLRGGARLFEPGERVPDLKEEMRARALGFKAVAGVDEAGRGPLAGPVVAAAVILPERISRRSALFKLRDSKQLSASRREELFDLIMDQAVAVGLGEASPEDIDRFNIFQASLMAMYRAVDALPVAADFCLVDGIHPLPFPPSKSIIKGDMFCLSIAAASIVAKVARDRKMLEYSRIYPAYNFAKNKGYATADHKQALAIFGPSPIHRLSFEPVKVCLRRNP
jgi:ribonuclease HII